MAEPQRAIINHQWYACLPPDAAVSLSPLRQSSGVEVLDHSDGLVWLRGPTLDQSKHQLLRAVLGCQIFRPLEDAQLVPLGKSVPRGYQPTGDWVLLKDWLVAELPARRFAAPSTSKVRISLVRSVRSEPAALLCVPRADWSAYAEMAPQVRLDRLSFATSELLTIVQGNPLPPLCGHFYWLRDAIAAPVGYEWSPAVDAKLLCRVFGLQKGDIALFLADGGLSVICGDQFVGATRSAVRLSEANRAE